MPNQRPDTDEPPFATHLEDWVSWFLFNHDRLALYYPGLGTLERRWQFGVKLCAGMFALCVDALERCLEIGDFASMPTALCHKIQTDSAWFLRQRSTISDPDKRFLFLVQTQARLFELLHMIGTVLDGMEQQQTARQMQDELARLREGPHE